MTCYLLGGYDREEKAARAYDLAALKYWGPSTHINFPVRLLPDSLNVILGAGLVHSCDLYFAFDEWLVHLHSMLVS